MSLNINNMLNIGSIVKIHGSNVPIMVIGYSDIRKDTLYDYSGCIYPVGIEKSNVKIIFNNSDIEEVIDKGYSNGSEIEFKEKYIKSLNKQKNIDILMKKQIIVQEAKKRLPDAFQVRRLLPIGSIVKIKLDSENKYMITSNLVEIEKDGKKDLYQYMAALYPVGIVSKETNYFFNDDDITDIYYFGYNFNKEYLKNVINQNMLKGKNIHLE